MFAVAQTVPSPLNVERNVRDHVELARAAASKGADLVLFPELSLTGYDRSLSLDDAVGPADARLRPLQDLATASDLVIVVGAPVASSRGLHIAAIALMPCAAPTIYCKQHLHAGEEDTFVPGLERCGVPVGRRDVGLAICADITHPEHARAAAMAGSVVYAASCFLTDDGYEADAELLRRYAREHELLVLMANYGAPVAGWKAAGRSAIWSGDGELVACAPQEGPAIVMAEATRAGWRGSVVVPGDGLARNWI